MKVALSTADELEKEGISAEVIDLRTIRPLDWMTVLESVENKPFGNSRRAMAIWFCFFRIIL